MYWGYQDKKSKTSFQMEKLRFVKDIISNNFHWIHIPICKVWKFKYGRLLIALNRPTHITCINGLFGALEWNILTNVSVNYLNSKLGKGRFWNFTSFGTLPVFPLYTYPYMTRGVIGACTLFHAANGSLLNLT